MRNLKESLIEAENRMIANGQGERMSCCWSNYVLGSRYTRWGNVRELLSVRTANRMDLTLSVYHKNNNEGGEEFRHARLVESMAYGAAFTAVCWSPSLSSCMHYVYIAFCMWIIPHEWIKNHASTTATMAYACIHINYLLPFLLGLKRKKREFRRKQTLLTPPTESKRPIKKQINKSSPVPTLS